MGPKCVKFSDELAAKLIPFLYIIASHTPNFEAQSNWEVFPQSTYFIQRIFGKNKGKMHFLGFLIS